MVQKLSPLQINELHPFRFTEEKVSSSLSISVDLLRNEQSLIAYLAKLSSHIGADHEKVAASIFMKRYAFLAVIYLYSMTSWNGRLDISFSNVSIEAKDQDELWLPSFFFNEMSIEKIDIKRELWREHNIKILFQDHLFPLIQCLSKATKVSKLILWENVAVYIFWLYETVFRKEEISNEVAVRAKEDFNYLAFRAPGSLFGDYNENPLNRYFKQPIYIEELKKEVKPRSTCCFSYFTSNKKRCETCPRICRLSGL